jgi:hypothetical protein
MRPSRVGEGLDEQPWRSSGPIADFVTGSGRSGMAIGYDSDPECCLEWIR